MLKQGRIVFFWCFGVLTVEKVDETTSTLEEVAPCRSMAMGRHRVALPSQRSMQGKLRDGGRQRESRSSREDPRRSAPRRPHPGPRAEKAVGSSSRKRKKKAKSTFWKRVASSELRNVKSFTPSKSSNPNFTSRKARKSRQI